MRVERRMGWRSGMLAAALAAAGLTAGALVAPVPAAAQQGGGAGADALTLYEREIFNYPAQGRRNPFLPLNAGERLGPRFEDLQLNGVLFNPSLGSVATLTDKKTGRRYRVRDGDRLGEIRVTEIRATEVAFTITSYGVSRREVLRVKRDDDKETEG